MLRRTLIALPVAAAGTARAQHAPPGAFEAAEAALLKGRAARQGGIAIEMPVLSENGNSVDIAVSVDSPMSAADHVTAIHILAERNPYPHVASFHLSRRAGRAAVATRIRLATTQQIVVLAESSTGEVRRTAREVIVILGACVEGG
jgi:sulfur-oxidizing protein SoxY